MLFLSMLSLGVRNEGKPSRPKDLHAFTRILFQCRAPKLCPCKVQWMLPMSNSLTSKLRLNKIEVWRWGILCQPFLGRAGIRYDRTVTWPVSTRVNDSNSEVKPTVQYINMYASYAHRDILRLSRCGFFGLSSCLVLTMCTPMII